MEEEQETQAPFGEKDAAPEKIYNICLLENLSCYSKNMKSRGRGQRLSIHCIVQWTWLQGGVPASLLFSGYQTQDSG